MRIIVNRNLLFVNGEGAILEEKKIASRNTASQYLRKLEELGVLVSEQVGRETLYKNIALLKLLSGNS
jgi:DNA-binding transcriptional ArsR family regulator